ncbi:MAG: hypothetical protein AAF629_25990, partial [Chloroflexota bacterium]
MTRLIRQFFSDETDSAELKRIIALLKTLLIMTIILTSLSYVFLLINQLNTWTTHAIIVAVLVTALVGWLILWRGYVRLSGIIFISGIFVILAWITFLSGGLRSPTFASLFLLIFFTGLTLGRASALIYASLLGLASVFLIRLELIGRLPDRLMIDPTSNIIVHIANIASATIFVSYAAANIKRAFIQLQKNQHILETMNQDLQHQIIERKQAEKQLLYQANLLENVSDAIISTDTAFN